MRRATPPCEESRPRAPAPPARAVLVGTALALLTLAIYAPVRGFGFVNIDDPQYVLQNPLVLQGLTAHGLAEAFSSRASNWHPLTWLAHMADVSLFGLEPGAHHLVSALLHVLNALLLYAFLRGATGTEWRSAAVAALFAVHPLHVESVAWISERKDVLSAFFFLLALHGYRAWVARPRPATCAAVAVPFALSLLSKPMAVTFPFLLLVLDRWPFRRREGWRALVVEKLPLLALSAASAAMTWRAQDARAIASVAGIGLAARAENALVSAGAYLGQAAWPAGLAATYPHPALAGLEVPAWKLAAAALAIAAVSALVIRERARHPALLSGWLWYLGMLVPVIGLVQVGVQARADRYTYLPLVGAFVVVAWGAAAIVERWPRARTAVAAAGAAAVLALSGAARAQVWTWRDAETVNRHALAHTERNWVAWQGLGDALWRAGRAREAAEAFEQALRIRPDDAHSLNGLGALYGSEGRPDLALAPLQQAVRLDPGHADAWYNLGTALGQLDRPADAARCFRTAVGLAPEHAAAWFNLGVASLALGDPDGAARSVARLSRLDPRQAAELERRRAAAGASGAR